MKNIGIIENPDIFIEMNIGNREIIIGINPDKFIGVFWCIGILFLA